MPWISSPLCSTLIRSYLYLFILPRPSPLLHHQYANLIGDPYRRTQEALEADPSCVMAHCLKGMLAALSHADPIAVDLSLADAERDLMAYGVGEEGLRERVFASALRAWSAGRWREVNVWMSRGRRCQSWYTSIQYILVYAGCSFRIQMNASEGFPVSISGGSGYRLKIKLCTGLNRASVPLVALCAFCAIWSASWQRSYMRPRAESQVKSHIRYHNWSLYHRNMAIDYMVPKQTRPWSWRLVRVLKSNRFRGSIFQGV